jgi:hypothetical protein
MKMDGHKSRGFDESSSLIAEAFSTLIEVKIARHLYPALGADEIRQATASNNVKSGVRSRSVRLFSMNHAPPAGLS